MKRRRAAGRPASRAARSRTEPVFIAIAWRAGRSLNADSLIRRAARQALRAARFRTGTLSIAIVGRRAMAALHRRSMGVAGPTDVLTFDLGTRRGAIDGEIVVCSDVAVATAGGVRRGRSAAALRRAAGAELALYVVHGVLHLAGFDDHRPAEYERMHRLEDRILTAAGLGPVFSAGTRPRRRKPQISAD